MIQVRVDLRPLAKALKEIGQDVKTGPVIRDALNRGMDAIYTTARREIAKRANLPMGHITSGMKKIPASGGNLVAKVVNRNRWMSVKDGLFNSKDTGSGGWRNRTGSGVYFTPWKDQRQQMRSGFMTKFKSGHEGIFHSKGKSRLPIYEKSFGPNAAKEMIREDHGYTTVPAIMKAARERLQTRITHGYQRAVEAARARNGL